MGCSSSAYWANEGKDIGHQPINDQANYGAPINDQANSVEPINDQDSDVEPINYQANSVEPISDQLDIFQHFLTASMPRRNIFHAEISDVTFFYSQISPIR